MMIVLNSSIKNSDFKSFHMYDTFNSFFELIFLNFTIILIHSLNRACK